MASYKANYGDTKFSGRRLERAEASSDDWSHGKARPRTGRLGERAILAGDTETGVMVMRMEEGLDTGPIAMAERVPIGPDATAGDLHDRLARLGADLTGSTPSTGP